MSRPAEKVTTFAYGKPRKVEILTTQAETFWPGKLGAETTVTPQKYPHLKKLFVPSDGGVYLMWDDGSEYFIPLGNVKGLVFESE